MNYLSTAIKTSFNKMLNDFNCMVGDTEAAQKMEYIFFF